VFFGGGAGGHQFALEQHAPSVEHVPERAASSLPFR